MSSKVFIFTEKAVLYVLFPKEDPLLKAQVLLTKKCSGVIMAAVAEVCYQKINIHWFSYWPSVVTVCPIKYHHL